MDTGWPSSPMQTLYTDPGAPPAISTSPEFTTFDAPGEQRLSRDWTPIRPEGLFFFPHNNPVEAPLLGTSDHPLIGHSDTIDHPLWGAIVPPERKKDKKPGNGVPTDQVTRITPERVKHSKKDEARINSLEPHLQNLIRRHISDSIEIQRLALRFILPFEGFPPTSICYLSRNPGSTDIASVGCILCLNEGQNQYLGRNALRRFAEHFVHTHLHISEPFVCFKPDCRQGFTLRHVRDRHEQEMHHMFRPNAYKLRFRAKENRSPASSTASMNSTIAQRSVPNQLEYTVWSPTNSSPAYTTPQVLSPPLSAPAHTQAGPSFDHNNPKMDMKLNEEFPEALDLSGRVTLLSLRAIFNGNYSSVYHGKLGDELVAIKVLKAINGAKTHTMERKLRRERTVWARLHHPNVLPLYGFANDHELFLPFGAFISPWHEKGNAIEFLKVHGESMTMDARVKLWRGVVNGVAYIHGRDPVLVHGDLKTVNVLIDDQGNPQICDFGLVSIYLEEGSSGMTTTSPYTGTDRYLAYELLHDQETIEPTLASDIFALGCIGLECCFLQLPYGNRKKNRYQIWADIKAGKPPASRPNAHHTTQESRIWDLLDECWSQAPHQRPHARAILARLDDAFSSDQLFYHSLSRNSAVASSLTRSGRVGPSFTPYHPYRVVAGSTSQV
ncbi:hypothetical protein M408DRAFT_328291 [Serendipita vermifera MAFF 305830]|uniref:Protein kinase domain-containing protein n=1 Tax=Serendipita vermifera MAFF 305830 TaxID=933852 RepID=A0A0C3B0E4_SERVB|nr:hypothetical protein M408DRAFT_328291 [Serendipita vermifera MAFF 305830]